MSLVGFKAQNHRQQVSRRGPNPDVDDRGTPWDLFNWLHSRFEFTIDVAASIENAKLPRFYSIEDDGLTKSWAGERVWCNPPYSDIRPWIEKAWYESKLGCRMIVMLVPANRTEQAWWQELIENVRDQPRGTMGTEFLSGRIRFIRKGADGIGPNERPPFGCVLLIWDTL